MGNTSNNHQYRLITLRYVMKKARRFFSGIYGILTILTIMSVLNAIFTLIRLCKK